MLCQPISASSLCVTLPCRSLASGWHMKGEAGVIPGQPTRAYAAPVPQQLGISGEAFAALWSDAHCSSVY